MTNRIIAILTVVTCLAPPVALADETNAHGTARDLRSLAHAMVAAQNSAASTRSLAKDIEQYRRQLHDAFRRGDRARGTRLYEEYQQRLVAAAKERGRQLSSAREQLAAALAAIEERWRAEHGGDQQVVSRRSEAAERIAQLSREELQNLSEVDRALLRELLCRTRFEGMIRESRTKENEFLLEIRSLVLTIDEELATFEAFTTHAFLETAHLMSEMRQPQPGKARSGQLPTAESPRLPSPEDAPPPPEGTESSADDVSRDRKGSAANNDGPGGGQDH